MLLLLDPTTRVEITTPAERRNVDGSSLVIVPPGQSSVAVASGGRLARVFSARSTDLLEQCANAGAYATPHPGVADAEPWPDPPGGYRIRAYSVDVPNEPGRFGRIWRSTNLMVNWFQASSGPRDVTRMSPHAHPDFEQCSLVDRRRVRPPHPVAVDDQLARLARGRSRAVRESVGDGDPADVDPHQSGDRPGHQSPDRHLWAAAGGFFREAGVGLECG